jgi:undecaprenyl phosphate-alpha-L-ara4N flippase subunit ArnE
MIKNRWAVVLVLLSTFITSGGQILLKKGASGLSLDVAAQLGNVPLILGWGLYLVGAGMLVVALKYGDLSLLYPIYSLNFIWVSVLSPYFFESDSMNPVKWLGVGVVVLGVTCVGLGSGMKTKEAVK